QRGAADCGEYREAGRRECGLYDSKLERGRGKENPAAHLGRRELQFGKNYPMQTLIGRHAQTPGATITQAQAVQSSNPTRNTNWPWKKRRKWKCPPCSKKLPLTTP